MIFILLGPPGAGKGTYSAKLINIYKIPQISTGDILRAAVKAGTEIGKQAKDYMDRGLLVPDDVIVGIVEDRIKEADCSGGFLLDGFPRTVDQANALESVFKKNYLKLDGVINIMVKEDVLMKRLTGRRLCKKCGANFNVNTLPPAKPGVCDKCGGELFQRDDDKEEVIAKRLKVYESQTAPLIDYYKNKKIIKDIDASDGSIDDIVGRITQALSGK
jgi:adenylate kinase